MRLQRVYNASTNVYILGDLKRQKAAENVDRDTTKDNQRAAPARPPRPGAEGLGGAGRGGSATL